MRAIRVGMTFAALAVLLAAALPASGAAPRVAVKHGKHYGQRIFPDNKFTVADSRQLTGRRIHFKLGVDYPIVGNRVRRHCTNTTRIGSLRACSAGSNNSAIK